MKMLIKSPQIQRSVAIAPSKSHRATRSTVHCQATKPDSKNNGTTVSDKNLGLGDLLGPIGLTVGKSMAEDTDKEGKVAAAQIMQRAADVAGVSLGPIGLTVGSDLSGRGDSSDEEDAGPPPASIASMTTEEWRAKYERDGKVDLWVEEEFNSGSRLVGGRAALYGLAPGYKSGEGATGSNAPRHKVKIYNHFMDQEVDVEVPEDRYILWEAEDQGLLLPYACRMGCCTACAVKVKEGEMYQPQSLGISKELKERGYALMCVGFPLSDLVLETVPEDEVYELQFGKFFEQNATDPNSPSVIRDDFAIELALLDE